MGKCEAKEANHIVTTDEQHAVEKEKERDETKKVED